MSWWEALLLGVVQGLTEFLPVSSSGHLVIFQKLLGFEVHDLSFNVVSHIGTLCAVLVIYRRAVMSIAGDCFSSVSKFTPTPGLRVFMFMFVASLPTGFVGVALRDQFELLFNSLMAVGFALCLTGVMLFTTRRFASGAMGEVDIEGLASQLNFKKALFVGLSQALAITPGISRSGTTITAGLFMGLDKNSAALFSFMIAIPAMVGAAALEMSDFEWSVTSAAYLSVGFVTSFVFGLIGLSAVLRAVRRGRLDVFSYYLWAVGALCLFISIF